MAPRYRTYKSEIPDTQLLGFRKGKGYYSRGPALPAAAASDPFAPLSPRDITGVVNRFGGQVLTDPQIQQHAQSMVDPIVAAITKNANDRAAASASAIKGLTDEYARELGQTDYTAPYRQAESDQAAVDAALQQSLNGAGSDLASQLKARLAPMGADPAVQQAAAGLDQRGQAIGTTELAHGSSALSNLIARAAAASSYGQKMPGIARLSGVQGVEQANSQAANDIASGTEQALSQLPGILQALRNERGNVLANRGDLYTTLTGQNLTKATAKAGLENTAFDNTLAAENAAADNARQDAAAAETARHHRAQETQAAKKAKATKKTGGLTASQVQKYKGIALTIATQAKTGAPAETNAKGEVTSPALPPISRQQAIVEMEKEGVPEAIAVATANRVYGKPLTTAQKKKQRKFVRGYTPGQIPSSLGG